jgi:hypothetical protein
VEGTTEKTTCSTLLPQNCEDKLSSSKKLLLLISYSKSHLNHSQYILFFFFSSSSSSSFTGVFHGASPLESVVNPFTLASRL